MIRFKKHENGNVIVTSQNGDVEAIYNPNMNLAKHPREETIIISDGSS